MSFVANLKRLSTAWAVVLSASLASADETWLQFRGPTGQGHALGTGLPIEFGDTGGAAWKVALPGEGWSSPVSDGRTIWLTTAEPVGETQVSLRALAVDVSSGKLLHNVPVLPAVERLPKNNKNSHASPTPVLDNGLLFMHFGSYGSACLDTATAQVLWTNTSLNLEHKEGPGSSPIIYRNLMIFPCDGTDVQYIVALDKLTGKVAWRTERNLELSPNPDFRKAYSTPLVIAVDGRDLVISTAAWHVFAYEPTTGKEVWHVDYQPGFSNVPRPVFAQGLLLVCSGYMKPELLAIRPNGRGDVTKSHVVWRVGKKVPANPSPIVVGDLVYLVADKGIVTCLDLFTGDEVWSERIGGNFSASPLSADGRIYLSSEEGKVHVLAPGREFKVLAVNQLDGRIMASPMVLGRAIYFRTDQTLTRFETGARLQAQSGGE